MLRVIFLCAGLFGGPAVADKAIYLDLARKGWNYQLRTTMVGRDMAIPVHINGRDLAGATLCLVGEPPHPRSLLVIDAFRALLSHGFGQPVARHYAGPSAEQCVPGKSVILRLYSGHPTNRGLSADLGWMNETLALGLPEGRRYVAQSPAMAQTFFGRRGAGTHIMVKQPAHTAPDQIEIAFYKSILVEELFQAFTFGMDILLFDRSAGFVSKLQETPLNLERFPWGSHDFMRGLLKSNPGGLCPFDIFMIHAVALAPVDQTVEPSFIDYIDTHYDMLRHLTGATLADPRFHPLLDETCADTL